MPKEKTTLNRRLLLRQIFLFPAFTFSTLYFFSLSSGDTWGGALPPEETLATPARVQKTHQHNHVFFQHFQTNDFICRRKASAGKEGGIQALIHVLREGSQEAQVMATAALRNLVQDCMDE